MIDILVLVCLATAWMLVAICLQTFWITASDLVTTVKRLHQIPCANCQFFTGDYRLKCTVNPYEALTEDAINCSDFCPQK
jgi:hypothetical protein